MGQREVTSRESKMQLKLERTERALSPVPALPSACDPCEAASNCLQVVKTVSSRLNQLFYDDRRGGS